MTKCAICGGDIPDIKAAFWERIPTWERIEIGGHVLPINTLRFTHPHCHAGKATAAEEHAQRMLPVYWQMKPAEQEAILREARGEPA
jgi:hypothetical protein